jgi:hypothetical protein
VRLPGTPDASARPRLNLTGASVMFRASEVEKLGALRGPIEALQAQLEAPGKASRLSSRQRVGPAGHPPRARPACAILTLRERPEVVALQPLARSWHPRESGLWVSLKARAWSYMRASYIGACLVRGSLLATPNGGEGGPSGVSFTRKGLLAVDRVARGRASHN